MILSRSDLGDLGLPIRLAAPVRFHTGEVAASGPVTPEIALRDLDEEFSALTGGAALAAGLRTRVFDLSLLSGDEVLVRTAGTSLPLIVRRAGEIIVNFDLQATQAFSFTDSDRPIYTYVPGFNIHAVPEEIRRPLSNMVQSLRAPKRFDLPAAYRRLPLTDFEYCVLLINTIVGRGTPERPRTFQWPSGKRAVFVALHDVDTGGFLRRRERDSLFRVEAKHGIRSTWFVPTAILSRHSEGVEFLLESGHEVGWHGHKHDHRDHVRPYADRAVQALTASRLVNQANVPTGMRLPKLLKSNYLFELLERSCPALCYDTSFLRGIAPHRLWLNGRESRILEIPTTVPTDIRVYNELRTTPRVRRAEAMLKAQVARTEQLIEAGALISIVTHPEKALSERPDFLDLYDQYLSYIRQRTDIWFTTAGELFTYWTSGRVAAATQPHDYQSRSASTDARSGDLSRVAQPAR
jgi:peptidoglycan/xylan/chitin deacetylase (PgdA/CDA1 family)